MRKGVFFLNFLLTALVGLACLAGLLMRTFAPSVRVPEMNLSTVLLLSLAALMLEQYLAPGAARRWLPSVILAVLTFALLPGCAGTVAWSEAWKLGLVGGVVFGASAALYSGAARRSCGGACSKAAPAVWALLLYLAGQCLTWAV